MISPNQNKNSHKLCDETEYSLLSLAESQWKRKQQHDQNVPIQVLQNKF